MRLLIIALLLSLSVVFAAEIRYGQLYLEVLVSESKQILISSTGNINIGETGSPLAKLLNGDVSLQLVASDDQDMLGLINKAEVISADSIKQYPDANIRERFIWQDGKLAIQYEKLTFEDKYFTSKGAAESYAAQTGYPKQQISYIPMQNASLKVSPQNGEAFYYQLPVKLSAMDNILFNGIKNDYNGTFIIKSIQGKLVVTNLVDIENYVAGVVPNEIGNSAPEEALKAQTVAARTHAISLLLQNKHVGDGYDLCNGTHCQVHKGNYLRETQIDKAVLDTKGIVMLYEDKIADGVYHSSCGGKTESNQNAWSGKAIPYLQGVACNPELDSLDLSNETNAINWINTNELSSNMASWEKRSEKWEKTLSKNSLQMNSGVRNPRSITILHRGVSGRIMRLKITGDNEEIIRGEYRIRQILGSLPSSFFYIANGIRVNNSYSLADEISIKGRGSGHGVGMCQVGALQKARAGWIWQDILLFYYPGILFSDDWLQTNNLNGSEIHSGE